MNKRLWIASGVVTLIAEGLSLPFALGVLGRTPSVAVAAMVVVGAVVVVAFVVRRAP